MDTTMTRRHFYPRADSARQPSPLWYFGRAVYVSRYDYRRIFFKFLAVGVPVGAAGFLLRTPALLYAAYALAALGLLMLAYSLAGLYRQYGHFSAQYFRRLLRLGGVTDGAAVADLHIGTYRHAYRLAELLPRSTVYSVDCWNVEGPPPEKAVLDVRDLEPAPADNPRIRPLRARDFRLPLPDESCDAVVFGFGTHEIPTGGPREQLFAEARRVLKPNGRALLFEHGYDFHNYLIFGPVISHVTRRDDWHAVMNSYFEDVRYERTSHAVDLFAGRRP
ncbi:MAG TPA: class I SAM-dependent methyltransferase [Pyrinomonadaceae bacterium]|nr:class I SAM-dependent methyltransferase [Pyrinomonadaceae bacterium]